MTREELSSERQARRAAILADALREADRRRRNRIARRAGAVVCASVLFAGIAVSVFRQGWRGGAVAPAPIARTSPTPAPSPAPTPTPSSKIIPPLRVRGSPPAPSKVVVQIIRREDVKPAWQTISDDQLLVAMTDAGKPSGIVNVDGTPKLVPIRRPGGPRS